MGTIVRGFRLLIVCLLLGTVLAACGSADNSDDAVQPSSAGAVYDGEAAEEWAYDSDEAYEGGGDVDYERSVAVLAGDWNRKVIRSADLSLTVSDLDRALIETRRLASDAGGFVFEASTSFEGTHQVGRLILDVPTERFDGVVASLLEAPFVERVEREMTSSQDVTEEYVDLESRLRNLEASETRYLGLLEDAQRLDDILALERELTRVRGEIETIQGRLRYLESRTSMSRINVTLRPASDVTIVASGPRIDLAPVVSDAWNASLNFIGSALTIVVTILVFFWWLWPLGLVTVIAFMIWRGRRRQPAAMPDSSS